MRKPAQTIDRQWDILSLIPREPLSLSTAEVLDRLRSRGHEVDIRTVQRDFVALETRFMLTCRTEGRTNYWSWSNKQPMVDLPTMSTVTAITLLLARDYLIPVMPAPIVEELSPYFSKATEKLKGTKLANWRERVSMIGRGPALAPATVDSNVFAAVQMSLLDNRQLNIRYRSRSAEKHQKMTVNPLGLVSRDGVFYLVATLWKYHDIRQLALHRMTFAEIAEQKASRPRSFDLDSYINDEYAFAYPSSEKKIQLEALFDAGAAHHLTERALAKDQQLVNEGNGKMRLRASVADTQELYWWLLGFGDQVEVIRPRQLRRAMQTTVESMARMYGSNNPAKSTDRRHWSSTSN